MPAIGYRVPGDFDVENVMMVLSSGQAMDISSIVSEVNLFQDLTKHYMKCQIVIADAIGLFNTKNGFTGFEIFTISIRNKSSGSTKEPFVHYAFALYGVGKRTKATQQSEVFLIDGVSLEYYNTISKRISTQYTGQITGMIQKILNEYFTSPALKQTYSDMESKLDFKPSKKFYVDETLGNRIYTIPNITVDETLDFLVSKSNSNDGVPLFAFYEDSTGYNFRNLSSLVTEDEVGIYTYGPMNIVTDDDGTHPDSRKIITFNVVRENNFVRNAKMGLFKSKTYSIDLTNKRVDSSVYDYAKRSSEFSKLQPSPILGTVADDDCVVYVKPKYEEFGEPEFIGERESYRAHLSNSQIEMVIPGDSTLNVGMCIYARIPASTDLLYTDTDDDRFDRYLTGKYLITKLRHKLTGKTGPAHTILECIKDNGVDTIKE